MNLFSKVTGLFRRKPESWIEIREEQTPKGTLYQAKLIGGGSFLMFAETPGDCIRVLNVFLGEDPFELAALRVEELARDMTLRGALTAAFIADEIRKLRAQQLAEVIEEFSR